MALDLATHFRQQLSSALAMALDSVKHFEQRQTLNLHPLKFNRSKIGVLYRITTIDIGKAKIVLAKKIRL